MSKKLLMNNVISGGNVNKCPVCGEAEDKCTCTPLMVDDIYLGWAIAGKYAGVTACMTDAYWKGYYCSTFKLNTNQFTLFNEKMAELGFTRTNSESDTSADYMTYYGSSWIVYWNTKKYEVNITKGLKSDLNLFLRDFTYEQLELIKNYGKTNYPYADILKMYTKFYKNLQRSSCTGGSFGYSSYYKDTTLYSLYNYSTSSQYEVSSASKEAGFKTYSGDYPDYPNTYNYVWVTGNDAYVQIQPIACIIDYYLKHPEELT